MTENRCNPPRNASKQPDPCFLYTTPHKECATNTVTDFHSIKILTSRSVSKSKKKRLLKRERKATSLRKKLNLHEFNNTFELPNTVNSDHNHKTQLPSVIPETQLDDDEDSGAGSMVIPETQLDDDEDSGAGSMENSPPMISSRPPSPRSLQSMLSSPDMGNSLPLIQTLLSASILDRMLPPLTPIQDTNQEVTKLQSALLQSKLECDTKANDIRALSEEISILKVQTNYKEDEMKMLNEAMKMKSEVIDTQKTKSERWIN